MSMSLLDLLQSAASKDILSKDEFGRIMHDPDASEEEIQEALKTMADAGGYENLAD